MIRLVVEMLREMAAAGKLRTECANELGVSYQTIGLVARKHGIKFRHASEGDANCERSSAMAALYAAGFTLEEIGQNYGVTRERVRQIIAKRHGMSATSGGGYLRAKLAKQSRQEKAEARCQAANGCSRAQFKSLRDAGAAMLASGFTPEQTPIRAYTRQRTNAAVRGIEWHLNIWQWWTIWQMSGHWEERGRGHGYMMCRKGDTGPYELGNVVIATGIFNGSIQPNNPYRKSHPDFDGAMARRRGSRASQPHVSHHTVHTDLPRGVTRSKGAFQAQIYLGGRNKYLGRFPTPEAAYAAYLEAAA